MDRIISHPEKKKADVAERHGAFHYVGLLAMSLPAPPDCSLISLPTFTAAAAVCNGRSYRGTTIVYATRRAARNGLSKGGRRVETFSILGRAKLHTDIFNHALSPFGIVGF